MEVIESDRGSLLSKGFAVIDGIYSPVELKAIELVIDQVDKSNPTFRKTNDLFAIRQFLREIPAAYPLIFNEGLKN